MNEMKRLILMMATISVYSAMAVSCAKNETPQPKPEGILELGERVNIRIDENVPYRGYLPDGKISSGKFFGSEKFTIFWSEVNSMMLDNCSTPWLEDNINKLRTYHYVMGPKKQATDGFTDGGKWMIGVHPSKASSRRLIGFFHAESHWKNQSGAYKSIGVAYSDDNGKNWTNGTKILSGADPKPATSANDGRSYGLGDGCVLYNESRKSWICYYSGYCDDAGDFVITMAESTDPEAKAGSWKKWDGKAFTVEGCNVETGLGGENVSISGLKRYHGGNPSVMYNTALEKWTMVFHSWGREIVWAESADGINWENAKIILSREDEPGGTMYPNLISPSGDLTGSTYFKLYYSADMNNSGWRTLCYREINVK